MKLDLFQTCSFVLNFVFVSFKADLKHSISERVPVESLDSQEALVVVGHRHKAKSLAFICLEVTNNLDVLKAIRNNM
jgi:hypothetical protein